MEGASIADTLLQDFVCFFHATEVNFDMLVSPIEPVTVEDSDGCCCLAPQAAESAHGTHL